MAKVKFSGRPSLNNENTKFGSFKWADNKKLMDAIQKVRSQLGGQPLPVRFKVKL